MLGIHDTLANKSSGPFADRHGCGNYSSKVLLPEVCRGLASECLIPSKNAPQNTGVNLKNFLFVPRHAFMTDYFVEGRRPRDRRFSSKQDFLRVTSMCSSPDNSLVAYGDTRGRIFMFVAGSQSAKENPERVLAGRFAVFGDTKRSSTSSGSHYASAPPHASYTPSAAAKVFSMSVDPLTAMPIQLDVRGLAILPYSQPHCAHLLVCSSRVAKLYRFVTTYDVPAKGIKMVDMIDKEHIFSLVSSTRSHSSQLHYVHQFAADHDNWINSLSVTQDGTKFFTSDNISVRLWSVNHPESSVDVLNCFESDEMSINAGEEGQNQDEMFQSTRIVSSRTFLHAPSLFAVCRSDGIVKGYDTRISLRFGGSRACAFSFKNPHRTPFGLAPVGACDLSPCSHLLAARDSTSVILWDVRVASLSNCTTQPGAAAHYSYNCPQTNSPLPSWEKVVRRWDLHPDLKASRIEAMVADTSLAANFSVLFSTAKTAPFNVLCTGSLRNTIFFMNPLTGNIDEDAQLTCPQDDVTGEGNSNGLHSRKGSFDSAMLQPGFIIHTPPENSNIAALYGDKEFYKRTRASGIAIPMTDLHPGKVEGRNRGGCKLGLSGYLAGETRTEQNTLSDTRGDPLEYRYGNNSGRGEEDDGVPIPQRTQPERSVEENEEEWYISSVRRSITKLLKGAKPGELLAAAENAIVQISL